MALLRFGLGLFATMIAVVLVVPIVLAILPFLIVVRLTRGVARVLELQPVPWNHLIEFDQTFGWKPKPNVRAHVLADEVFAVSTDAEGWRGKSSLAESDIVAIGDSFAWGQGIDDENFFADLAPRPRIKAIGTNGYSLVQELLWLQQLAPLLNGKLVVWFIYMGNDLYDNLVPNFGRYRRPFIRQTDGAGEWEIVTSHLSAEKWPFSFEVHADGVDYYAKLADLCSHTLLADRAYLACGWLIRKGRDLCRAAGAELIVITIPDATQLHPEGIKMLLKRGGDPRSFNPDFPDQRIAQICEDLGVTFLAGKRYFDVSHYKKRDCHWNKSGHQQFAEILSQLHRSCSSLPTERASRSAAIG